MPFITAGKLDASDAPSMVGSVRTVQAASGGIVRERLIAFSDREMRLRFHTFEGVALTLNYIGHRGYVPLRAEGDQSLSFRECSDAAGGDVEKASRWQREPIFEPVLGRLEAVFREEGSAGVSGV